jgi:hypothetical protein
LCAPCRDWIWGRDHPCTPRVEFESTYGKPGVNYSAWPDGHPATTDHTLGDLMALKYTCQYCGSDNITQNADVELNTGAVVNYFDDFTCGDCEQQSKGCNSEEVPDPPKKYSVLLLYPDYMTDNFGQDTYFGCAEAATPAEAISAVQQQAVEDNGWDVLDVVGSLDDLFCLLCIVGQHTDIKP